MCSCISRERIVEIEKAFNDYRRSRRGTLPFHLEQLEFPIDNYNIVIQFRERIDREPADVDVQRVFFDDFLPGLREVCSLRPPERFVVVELANTSCPSERRSRIEFELLQKLQDQPAFAIQRVSFLQDSVICVKYRESFGREPAEAQRDLIEFLQKEVKLEGSESFQLLYV